MVCVLGIFSGFCDSRLSDLRNVFCCLGLISLVMWVVLMFEDLMIMFEMVSVGL